VNLEKGNHDLYGSIYFELHDVCTLVSLTCPFSSTVSFVSNDHMNRYLH